MIVLVFYEEIITHFVGFPRLSRAIFSKLTIIVQPRHAGRVVKTITSAALATQVVLSALTDTALKILIKTAVILVTMIPGAKTLVAHAAIAVSLSNLISEPCNTC